MKIAVFYPTGIWGCAWSCQVGIVTTLRAMGHDVINCPVDFGVPEASCMASVSELYSADLVMVSAIEYLHGYLNRTYGAHWFAQIAPKTINLYTETLERDDQVWNFDMLKPFASTHVFPAKQDAERTNGHYLPFGVDTEMFYPELPNEKSIDAGFVGTLYAKRVGYIEKIGVPITHVGSPVTRENGVYQIEEGTNDLRRKYNQMKVFVNLPAYSRLLVTKVFECMACGTFLVTPLLDHPTALDNMGIFQNIGDVVYYRPDDPVSCGHLIRWYLDHDNEREQIAMHGMQTVRELYSLRKRLQTILELV